MASDRSFMQYRGFGPLHSRVLLAQQYDIERLEEELDDLDRWDEAIEKPGVPTKLGSKERDDTQCLKIDMPTDFPFDRTRPEVLADLKQQLMCYGECKAQRNVPAMPLTKV